MIKHGFSYEELCSMPIPSIRFWTKELEGYYEELREDI